MKKSSHSWIQYLPQKGEFRFDYFGRIKIDIKTKASEGTRENVIQFAMLSNPIWERNLESKA